MLAHITPTVNTLTLLERTVRAFLTDRQARNLSPKTIDYYANQLRYFSAYVYRRFLIENVEIITPDHIRDYLVTLQLNAKRPATVHAAYRAIRSLLNWYESEYEPDHWHNPIHKVNAPKVPDVVLAPVQADDVTRLIDVCDRHTFTGQRDRAMFLCLLDTGLRAAELISLRLADVNTATGEITVCNGKGGKHRIVFLGTRSRREVSRYLRMRQARPDALWLNDDGLPLRYAGLRQLMRRRSAQAGIANPGLHAFRRAFALACLRNGVDLISLQRLMGHADLSVLRKYLAQLTDDLAAAHRRAGPVDKLL